MCSMISKQVKELRELADYWKSNGKQPSHAIKEAADTIEALSAKVATANMEKSEIYYGGRKQRVLTVNMQIDNSDTKSDIIQLLLEIIDETNDKGYCVMNAFVDEDKIFDYRGFSKNLWRANMDNTTAINMLKMRNMGVNLPDSVYEMAIDVLEKQIPQKINFESNLNDYESRFICKCGKVIVVHHNIGVMDNHNAPNYCSNCGMAIDWGDCDV